MVAIVIVYMRADGTEGPAFVALIIAGVIVNMGTYRTGIVSTFVTDFVAGVIVYVSVDRSRIATRVAGSVTVVIVNVSVGCTGSSAFVALRIAIGIVIMAAFFICRGIRSGRVGRIAVGNGSASGKNEEKPQNEKKG